VKYLFKKQSGRKCCVIKKVWQCLSRSLIFT
jgi:hypothetical protein